MRFEEFVEAELPGLLRFATVMCGTRDEAEDVVQEVLIRVQKSWARVTQADYPTAYVRRMLINEFTSWRRRASRSAPSFTWTESIADPSVASTDRMALQDELIKLPRRQRAVLALRYYGGLTDAEIAVELGCAQSTVRAHATRALATLRIANSIDHQLTAEV